MIWSGAGLHATLLACFAVTWVTGIDPDRSAALYFLVLSPLLLILGVVLAVLSHQLHERWHGRSEAKGLGYKINALCGLLKCDFSHPPTVFFIPMPALSIISLIASLVAWSGIFK